jgi:hypothetical protein
MAYSQYSGGFNDDQQYGGYDNRMPAHQMPIRPVVDPDAEGEVDPTL